MTIWTALFRADGRPPSERLGGFSDREETDLPLHVEQCSRRYDALRASIDGIKTHLWLIVIVLIASRAINIEQIARNILGFE